MFFKGMGCKTGLTKAALQWSLSGFAHPWTFDDFTTSGKNRLLVIPWTFWLPTASAHHWFRLSVGYDSHCGSKTKIDDNLNLKYKVSLLVVSIDGPVGRIYLKHMVELDAQKFN